MTRGVRADGVHCNADRGTLFMSQAGQHTPVPQDPALLILDS